MSDQDQEDAIGTSPKRKRLTTDQMGAIWAVVIKNNHDTMIEALIEYADLVQQAYEQLNSESCYESWLKGQEA